MLEALCGAAAERLGHLQKALELAGSPRDFEELKRKARDSRTTWLVAGIHEPPGGCFDAPPLPPQFAVLATDGSQIDVDRHRSARCYLINIGRVKLVYGAGGTAMDSLPLLYAGREDLFMSDGLREQAVEGNLLGIKRSIEELKELSAMIEPAGFPSVALVDGSLIMWGLTGERYPDFVVRRLLDDGYLRELDHLQQLTANKTAAVAAYISYPRSTDVANALRLLLCPGALADCDRQCRDVPPARRPCEALSGVQDRDIFDRLLAPGQRSALFYSQSRVVSDRYGGHRVYFFYLKADGEIARLEVPEWVALDGRKLGLVHALVLDQCRLGYGYPVALAEAHEQAVVTGTDRAGFDALLEVVFARAGELEERSAKSRSKKTRWL
jgi:hypothetical protein